MKEIEKQMLCAISAHKSVKLSNTRVLCSGNKVRVYLYGNLIAKKEGESEWKFSSCGWHTPTTKSRLNALGAGIYQRDWVWYRDGKEFRDEI